MSDINDISATPRWYVAHTYSGYENKVKTNLEKIVENRGLGHLIFDVRIPVEVVVEQNGDETKQSENKLFPSYVLVKMIMSDESWHVVRNIRGVTGFVGPGSRPVPLTDAEVEALNVENASVQITYGVGSRVVICGGLFKGYTGVVQDFSDDKKEVTVLVSTERRDMPIRLDTRDVKLEENK